MDRGKTVTQCKPRGKPFRPRSIGRYLVGRHPLRSKGGNCNGPGLNATSTSLCPQPLGLASRSRSQEGKPGRYESRRTETQPCQRAASFGLTPVTGRLIIQDTPTCRPEIVKEIAGGFVRLGEKATEVLRRLEERPGFPGAQQHE
jgi:hypothetical protein